MGPRMYNIWDFDEETSFRLIEYRISQIKNSFVQNTLTTAKSITNF